MAVLRRVRRSRVVGRRQAGRWVRRLTRAHDLGEAAVNLLLGVAHEIIKREGTDALTLAHLAEQAGVSKPIAYDHFGTRAGLLAALFRFFDAQQVEQMTSAVATDGDSLRAATEIAAAGNLDCLVGPEYEELCAALLAYEETKDYLRDSRAYFAYAYQEVFAPFVALEGAGGRAILTGLVGAAEALARDMHDKTIGRRAAINALANSCSRRSSPSPTGSRSVCLLDDQGRSHERRLPASRAL